MVYRAIYDPQRGQKWDKFKTKQVAKVKVRSKPWSVTCQPKFEYKTARQQTIGESILTWRRDATTHKRWECQFSASVANRGSGNQSSIKFKEDTVLSWLPGHAELEDFWTCRFMDRRSLTAVIWRLIVFERVKSFCTDCGETMAFLFFCLRLC